MKLLFTFDSCLRADVDYSSMLQWVVAVMGYECVIGWLVHAGWREVSCWRRSSLPDDLFCRQYLALVIHTIDCWLVKLEVRGISLKPIQYWWVSCQLSITISKHIRVFMCFPETNLLMSARSCFQKLGSFCWRRVVHIGSWMSARV